MFHRSTYLSSCLAASALLLGACTESGDAPASGGPTITNAGLVTQPGELAGDGDLWLVAAREFEAGGRDLDGDGDAFDLVVFVDDLASGTMQNTRLALSAAGSPLPLAVRGRLAAFTASESSSGGRDLNSDGDALDDVLFVYDSGDRSSRVLALAMTAGLRPTVGDGLVAFSVSEAAQDGQDLDGDGDATGDVLHVFDRTTGSTTNTRQAVTSQLFLGGGRVAQLVPESGVDRNGDGDTRDLVLSVFDPATGTSASSGLASDGNAPLTADGAWLVAVPESEQGGRDLNGDGDSFDAVFHVFDPRTDFVRNLRLVTFAPSDVVASRPVSGRASFAILASESGFDRNGDGDGFDDVPFTYDPRTDRLTNTGVAAAPILVFAGSSLGFLGLEFAEGQDLDGDGDLLDAVAHLTDPVTGRTTDLRQDAVDLRGSEDFLLLARLESTAGVDSNGVDSNLDGDQADVIVHAFDRKTSLTTNTRIASADVFGASASELLLYVDEAGEGRDLNGDRDRADQVFVLFDVSAKTATSLNLAGGTDDARFASLSRSGRLVLLANERSQGADFDSDGDLSDQVFHRGR